MIAGAAARLAEGTLPHLPSVLDVPIATVGGTLAYRASSSARDAVRENLAIVAPERRDRERLVRQTFVEQVRHYIEIFRLARLDHDTVRRAVVMTGWERFVAAVERGNGVIVASAHVGPISVCGQIIAANGYDITLPIEKETDELARSINRARTRMGLRFIETDSALGIHRVLKRGGILGVLADRAVTGVGERVPFFGRPALLPSVHVALALRTGAVLLPAFAHRDGNVLRAVFEPELELPRTGDRDADVREGVRRWAAVLEPHIRVAPEQWSVFEAVWRR
ncbi:MAG TPA: lysophospholipid acyltransferase family protein [Candidatus Limnocylindria bacterium]|nr:lysophospholipid acyltransferase family protein [Candidatus Limnocylindria bacterium]